MNDGAALAGTYAVLCRAAARKRIYAARARQAGRLGEARLLGALAASEEQQARRIFNNYRGQIDRSEHALATIFKLEMGEVLAEYERQLLLARESGNDALLQALTQLRRAETRLRSFYDQGRGELAVARDEQYYVCPFCGYLGTGAVPDKCPVCGAAGESFREAS